MELQHNFHHLRMQLFIGNLIKLIQLTDFVNHNTVMKIRTYCNMNRCILCTQARFSHAGSHIVCYSKVHVRTYTYHTVGLVYKVQNLLANLNFEATLQYFLSRYISHYCLNIWQQY